MTPMRWCVLFSFILMVSAFDALAKQYPDFDEKKPSVIILGRTLFEDRYAKPPKVDPENLELIKTLHESGKFNIIAYDMPNASFTQALTDALGGEAEASKIMNYWEDTSNPNSDKVRASYHSGFHYLVDYRKPKRAFYEIVDRYHHYDPNKSGGKFSYSGKNPYQDFPDSKEALFDLGLKAFADDFDMNSLLPELTYNPEPICKLGEKVFDISTCLNIIETEFHWIDKVKKICGLFEKGIQDPKKALRKEPYIRCEPERVRAFESNLRQTVIPTCQNARECLDKVSGQNLVDLSDAFNKILIHERVQTERDKVYLNKNPNYLNELVDIQKDISEFKKFCDEKYFEEWLGNHLKDPENKKLYEERILNLENHLTESLFDHLSREKSQEVIQESINAYNGCLFHTYDSGAESQYPKFKNCEYVAFSQAMKELAVELSGDDDNRVAGLRSELKGVCNVGSEGESSFVDQYYLDSFDLAYDSQRCFDALAKADQEIKLNGRFNELEAEQNKSRNRNFFQLGYENLQTEIDFKEYFEECMKKRRADEKDCEKESYDKAKANSLYLSLTREGNDDSKKGEFKRNEASRRSFVNQVLENPAILACYTEKREEECNRAAQDLLRRSVNQGPIRESSLTLAQEALEADLTPLVKTLSRDISVFHWGSREHTGVDTDEPVSLNSIKGMGYIKLREYMFHTGPWLDRKIPDAGATMAGRGLYAAADPNATRSYGETLYEIELDEGLLFLDLREGDSDGDIPISQDTYKKLQAAGCDVDYYSQVNNTRTRQQERAEGRPEHPIPSASQFVDRGYGRNTGYMIQKAAFEKIPECNRVFSRVINKLDVNFLAYKYKMSRPDFCDNSYSSTAAFVMIDAPVIGNVKVYNQAAIQEAIKDFEENGTPIPERYKRLLDINERSFHAEGFEKSSDEEIVKYWKERIFTCDSTIEEDQLKIGRQRY